MRRSIRMRLVGSYVLLALLTVAAAGIVAQGLVAREVARRQAATLRSNAEAIAAEALTFLWPAPRDAALSELARSASFLLDARVEIEDAAGETVADSGSDDGRAAFVLFDDMPIHVDEHEARAYRVFIRREGGPWGGTLNFDWLAEGSSSAGSVAAPVGVAPSIASPMAGDVTIELEGDATLLRVEALERLERPGSPPAAASANEDQAVDTAEEGSRGRTRMVIESRRATIVDEWTHDVTVDDDPGIHGLFVAPIDEGASIAPVVASIGDPAAPLGRVRISEGTDLRPAALAATRRAFSFAALVAALVAAGAGLVVARGMSAPLSALAETAGRMADGDLSARAAPHGEDEIGRLARQFNHMADGLQQSFDALAAERDALRRFIADASHELRTPITALRNFNEILCGPAEDDPVARAEFLAESAAQLDRLEWITGHLLDLSRLEAGLIELEREAVPTQELFEAVLAPFRPSAAEREVRLELEGASPSSMLWIDGSRMILALSNLVDNALRHAPDGGRVGLGVRMAGDVDVSETDAGASDGADKPPRVHRLWVTDDGPGVPAAERGRIFERFYRGADEPAGGTGLGLAIVEGIVRAHGGTIEVCDARGGGARFELRLPAG